ncbi:MAG: hypothetical protein JRH16_15100 [Deltaproteobacteria bacterium]|nr:hypothetical protein [Deltaproteobacteria bacterium]MBW2360109.1 hypothetical protein [Deltaproteobacteria bacterium]
MSARAWSVAGAAIAFLYLVHVWWLAGVAEDAFISFRYARHLAQGLGLVWNPGEPPVEGYTNFLWVLLTSLFVRFDWDVPRAAQVVGALAGLAALANTGFVARGLGWKRRWALLPMGLLAISGPFAAWAGAGLETLAFTALSFAALNHAAGWARDGNAGDRFALMGALLLAALTRPEGLLVAGVLLPLAAALGLRGERARLARSVAALALAYGAYFLWRWYTFGYPLPNTFYAKTGGGLAQAQRGAAYLGYFVLHYAAPWLPALVLASWAGRVWPHFGPRDPFFVLASAFVVAWTAYVVAVGGDYMAMYRFAVPALPVLALLLASRLRQLVRSAQHGSVWLRAAAAGTLAFGALGTLLHSTPLEAFVFDVPPRMHGNYRGVETERWHVARLTRIAEGFARRAESASASVATDAIGAMGWFSGLRVYGAHGLVDPQIAHQSAAVHAVGGDYAGHDRRDLWRLFERQPTYFMFTRELRETKPEAIEVPDSYADAVASSYRLQSIWLEDPANAESGWFSFLERRDAGGRSR